MEQPQEGNIIKVIKKKNCTIYINDLYIPKTEAEQKKVDDEISAAAWAIVHDLRRKGIKI